MHGAAAYVEPSRSGDRMEAGASMSLWMYRIYIHAPLFHEPMVEKNVRARANPRG